VTVTEPPRAAARRRLPDGFTARIRSDLLRNADGLLVGGSPLRAVRLSPAAQRYVDGDRVVVRDAASAEVAARLLDGNLADPEPNGGDVKAVDLTVVIPVRDRAEQLDRCLSALVGLRCIVVDDASHGRAAVAAVVARRRATLVPLDHNVGPAAARNAGLAHVRTPFVAFVDSDVEVTATELLGLAEHLADEKVALVGPLVRGRSRSTRPRWFERYDAAASSLDLGQVGARVQPGAAVAWLPSACLVGRAAALREVEGFDGRLRVGEDVDLIWRLVRADAIVRYDPTRVAHHDTRTTLRGWLGRKFVYGTGGAALAQRHGNWTAPAVLSATTALGATAALARRRWSLAVAAVAVVSSALALRNRVPQAGRHGVPLPVDLAVRGFGWGMRQESALLLRHWWPATLAGCLLSRHVRRMVVTSFAVDIVQAARHRPGIGPFTMFAARRLDDLAYGAGLWVGGARQRSARCLIPRRAR
jgi:mycofactocin system glycosyltransferase